jgi:hypothetical protein
MRTALLEAMKSATTVVTDFTPDFLFADRWT